MRDPYRIIKTVSITEKTNAQMEDNQYTFIVDRSANKKEVKHAIQSLFDRKVKSVNIAIRPGKKKRTRFGVGQKPDRKMAIVTLQAGEEAIDIL